MVFKTTPSPVKVGYRAVFEAPLIVTCMTLSLHNASLRLRTLVCEVLAALCVLSPNEGEKLVLASFSEYRVAHVEMFRFEELIRFLKFGLDDDAETLEDFPAMEGVWEAKAATMTLLNALSNCPDNLEERVLIREEFSRRGLNEAIVVRELTVHWLEHYMLIIVHQALRYMRPPEHLLKQLSVYTEEKFEDEEDLRERSLSHAQKPKSSQHSKDSSEFQSVYQDLMLLVRRHQVVDAHIVDILKKLTQLLDRNNGDWCVLPENSIRCVRHSDEIYRDHIGISALNRQ
jgi:diaphanous 1